MRLIFAKPTYGTTGDPMFDKNHRLAIMHASANGHAWVGDASPDRLGWAAARNSVAMAAISDEDAEGVFWVDSDILLPVDAITKLVAHGLDFVSGLYFQRGEPFWPVMATLGKSGGFQWAVDYPADVVAPMDGVGFGCAYTSVKLLRAVSGLRESQESGPFGGDFGKKTYGEDFTFCLRAKKAGFQPHIDTGVKCEHQVGLEFINEVKYKSQGINSLTA